MPGFNGKGPSGRGPMTGGGRGYCMVPIGSGQGTGAARERFSSQGRRSFGCSRLRMNKQGRGRGCGQGLCRMGTEQK